MNLLSFLKSRGKLPPPSTTEEAATFKPSAYVSEYLTALNRTEELGFEAPMRVLVRKDCIDMEVLRPILLDYFEAHSPEELVGQTAAINFALVPLIYDKIGIPLNLTIGWVMRKGKPMFQHDERLIHRFLEGKTEAWLKEGCPFHFWMTSPACEVLDVTFAMNLGWAKNREECARLIVYQSASDSPSDSIYHPTLVGPDFFHKTGGVL